MNRAEEHKKPLSERLPKHRPARDLWPGIESGLGAAGSAPLGDRLPVHRPARNLWPLISRRIAVPWYSPRSPYFRGGAALLVIVALMFFLLNRGTDESRMSPPTPSFAEKSPSQYSQPGQVPADPKIHQDDVAGENIPVIHPEKIPIVHPEKSQPSPEKSTLPLTAKSESSLGETGDVQQEIRNTDVVTAIPATSAKQESTDVISAPEPMIHTMPAITFFNQEKYRKKTYQALDLRHKKTNYPDFRKEISLEAGIYFQPGYIKNISTINNDWHYSPGLGVSLTMVQRRFLLETGISTQKSEFEDKIDIDYFAYVFLGTVINTEAHEEEFVNNQGDTLSRTIYSVELIDVYDSAFVEEEKNDVVKLSTACIPITAGYRISDRGRYFLDVKAGLDLLIVTGRVIPGNPGPTENIKVTDVRNSLAGKYSVKWKYHLALGAGFRVSERFSLYAEPTLWWYPEGIRNQETRELKNPFEAAMKLGLKWDL